MGIEPTNAGATIRCVSHFTTSTIFKKKHVPGGTRTPDPRLRRPMLYPAELLAHIGAGDGNRTHVAGLEGQNSTIELHPQLNVRLKRSIGVEGFEPPAPWSQTMCATKLRQTPFNNLGSKHLIIIALLFIYCNYKIWAYILIYLKYISFSSFFFVF